MKEKLPKVRLNIEIEEKLRNQAKVQSYREGITLTQKIQGLIVGWLVEVRKEEKRKREEKGYGNQ